MLAVGGQVYYIPGVLEAEGKAVWRIVKKPRARVGCVKQRLRFCRLRCRGWRDPPRLPALQQSQPSLPVLVEGGPATYAQASCTTGRSSKRLRMAGKEKAGDEKNKLSSGKL